MRRVKRKSGLHQYLEVKGLSKANEFQLQESRKEYWLEYKRKWRNDKRKKVKEITLSFTKAELKIIEDVAKSHKRNRTRFLKEAVFAYLDRRYLIIDPTAVNHIRQLLSMNYNALSDLLERQQISRVTSITLLEQITELEKKVLTALINPPLA